MGNEPSVCAVSLKNPPGRVGGFRQGFETVVRLIAAAGLEEILQNEVATVFAPSDEAFAAVDPEFFKELGREPNKITKLLSNHIVYGVCPSEMLTCARLLVATLSVISPIFLWESHCHGRCRRIVLSLT